MREMWGQREARNALECVEADRELLLTCPAARERVQARQAPARGPQPATRVQMGAQLPLTQDGAPAACCAVRTSVGFGTCSAQVWCQVQPRGRRGTREAHSLCRFKTVFPESKRPTLAQARTLQACSFGPCLARQAVPVLLGGDEEEQTQGQVEEVQAGHGHQEA